VNHVSPELTIVCRNWLNDNNDKAIIFNRFLNGNLEEEDVILKRPYFCLAYKKYVSWMDFILSLLF